MAHQRQFPKNRHLPDDGGQYRQQGQKRPENQRISLPAYQAIAAIAALQGMVKIHAQTIPPATPQRTARHLASIPPAIAPVIVWVMTRIRMRLPEQGNGTTAVGAETTRLIQLRDAIAHGLDDTPATKHGPQTHGTVADYPQELRRLFQIPACQQHIE
jgi:hypothetical protein